MKSRRTSPQDKRFLGKFYHFFFYGAGPDHFYGSGQSFWRSTLVIQTNLYPGRARYVNDLHVNEYPVHMIRIWQRHTLEFLRTLELLKSAVSASCVSPIHTHYDGFSHSNFGLHEYYIRGAQNCYDFFCILGWWTRPRLSSHLKPKCNRAFVGARKYVFYVFERFATVPELRISGKLSGI